MIFVTDQAIATVFAIVVETVLDVFGHQSVSINEPILLYHYVSHPLILLRNLQEDPVHLGLCNYPQFSLDHCVLVFVVPSTNSVRRYFLHILVALLYGFMKLIYEAGV
jgi:hypothetical protein